MFIKIFFTKTNPFLLLSFILLILFNLTEKNKLYSKNTGVVAGHIFNEVGEPLVEANVTILGTNYGAATNDKGYYFITNIYEGEYEIQVQYIGYFTERTAMIPIKNDATVKIDFNMAPNEMVMDEAIGETEQEVMKTPLQIAKFKNYNFLKNDYKIKYVLMVGGIPVFIPIHEDVYDVGVWAHIEYFFWGIFN